jgi:SAM-dependent methyltransferase
MKCFLCGGAEWRSLPIPTEGRSVTTSGIIISQELEREQCMSCGLLRKAGGQFLGNSRFYEEQYENYYKRPGVARYDGPRYAAMAAWMKAALGEFVPQTILDIGCGAGWSMAATASIFNQAAIQGVEPSAANADKAKQAGFVVYPTRLGSGQTFAKKYDLIYSNNVLQHVVNPMGFLNDITAHLSPDGYVVFILPDAAEPSNEMLWCDHNFSFRATDLALLSRRTGWRMSGWQPNPADNSLLNKQLVILRREGASEVREITPDNGQTAEEMFERRSSYLLKWRALDRELTRRSAGFDRVFNFGASMWTWLLAGYCPTYWSKVKACLVDGERGLSVDKEVIPTEDVSLTEDDCIVLGVNPVNQAAFADRLRGQAARVITWSDQMAL